MMENRVLLRHLRHRKPRGTKEILEYFDMQEILWNGETPIYPRIMKIWRFIVLV